MLILFCWYWNNILNKLFIGLIYLWTGLSPNSIIQLIVINKFE